MAETHLARLMAIVALLCGAIVALLCGAIGQAAAIQRDTPEQIAAPEEEIVVLGERQLDEQVRTFVQSLSVTPSGEDQLARWDRNLCAGVIGLPREEAQFVIDRISMRAVDVGLRPGAAGCRANLIIFIAPDAEELARRLVSRSPALFGHAGAGTLGPDALRTFFGPEPRAVSWWHVAFNVRAAWATGTGGSVGPLTRRARQDIDRAIFIVDAERVSGVRLEALADYLAMAALAQIDPQAETLGFHTILNLFADLPAADKPTSLTEWDIAYLHGLYDMSRFAVRSAAQEEQVSRTIIGRVRER